MEKLKRHNIKHCDNRFITHRNSKKKKKESRAWNPKKPQTKARLPQMNLLTSFCFLDFMILLSFSFVPFEFAQVNCLFVIWLYYILMSLPLSWALSALYAVLLSRLDSLVNCFQCFRRQCLCCPGLFFSLFFSFISIYSIFNKRLEKSYSEKKATLRLWYDVKLSEEFQMCGMWMILLYMWLILLIVGWYGIVGRDIASIQIEF